MKRLVQVLTLAGFFALALLTGVGCSGGGSGTKVKLRLNWFPEMEHGGYYAALAEGYYKAEGLDVEILPGGPEYSASKEVALGGVDFGVGEADYILLARQEGIDVLGVLAPFQKSPISIMVHESSDIKSLNDLKDVTLAIDPTAPYAKYLRKKLPLPGVKVVPYTGGVTQFLSDPNTAQQGFAFSEPILVERERENGAKNADPRVLLVSEIGYNPYTNVLIASGKTIKENPELVKKMVRASAKGWKKYLESPANANEQIRKVNPVMDVMTLASGAEVVKKFALDETTEKHGFGHMTEERWAQTLKNLEEAEVLPAGKVKASEAFDTQFLPGK